MTQRHINIHTWDPRGKGMVIRTVADPKVGGAPVCLSIVFRDDEGFHLGARRQRIVLE